MDLRDKNGLTEAEFLARYQPGRYPRPSVTADIVVLARAGEKWKVLLVRRGGHPYLGSWALPGGFANQNESVDATAARELEEETGLKGLPLAQLGLFSTPGRDPRTWVMSEAYVALTEADARSPRAGDDAAEAAWFTVDARQEQERLELTLRSSTHTLHESLAAEKKPGPNGPQLQFHSLHRGNLAFDHAEILAAALAYTHIL